MLLIFTRVDRRRLSTHFIVFFCLLIVPAAAFGVSPVFVRNYKVGGTLTLNGQPVVGAPVLLSASSYLRNSQTNTNFENQVKTVVVVTDSAGRFGPIDMPCYVDSETNSGFAPSLAGRALVIGQNAGFTIRSGSQCDEPKEPYNELLPFGDNSHPDRRNLGPNCGPQPSGGTSMHPNASRGEPVNVTNGNMWLAQTDYALPGVGINIRVSRVYNSGLEESGVFGLGWRSPFDESIASFANGAYLELRTETGRSYYFVRDPLVATQYRSADAFLRASRNGDGTYTVRYEDQRERRFHFNGRIAWARDANGVQTTFNYSGPDGTGQLLSVTDGSARSLRIVMNSGGSTVDKVCDGTGTDPCKGTGAVADYDYHPGTNRLKSVTYADGAEFRFAYAEMTIGGRQRFFLTSVRDARDNVVESHEYDSAGRAVSSERANGVEKQQFHFPTPTQPYTRVTYRKHPNDPELETRYLFDGSRGVNLIKEIVGNCSCGSGADRTTFEYDDALNLTKKTEAAGTLNRETAYSYDPALRHGRPVSVTDIYGTRRFTYDEAGRILTYQDRADSQTESAFTARYEYDPRGNLKKITDALGNVTTISYPTTGNIGLPDSVTDARANAVRFRWSAHGLLAELEDANQKTTLFTYDHRGRTRTVTNALGHVTTWNYFDDTRRRIEVVYPNRDKVFYRFDSRRLPESVTDERGKITFYEFDASYRLTKITDPLGHVREFGYDLMSNLDWGRDGVGNTTNFRYDAFDRLSLIEYPEIEPGVPRLTETFEYDRIGRLVRSTDSALRETAYGYDDGARTRSITRPGSGTTTVGFNARGHVTEVRDARGQIYGFAPDALGRVASQTRAGATMRFSYDPNGNMTMRTDYGGRVTRYSYDRLNRLARTDYGLTDAVQPPATYAYDDLSRLVSATNENGTVTFSYDSRNRPTATTDVLGHTVAYEYETTPGTNQTRLFLDGDPYAIYDFDDAGRISKVTDAASGSEIGFVFDGADRLVDRTLPNGIVTNYTYDGMSRLTGLRDIGPSATIFDRNYGYNNSNQIQRITEIGRVRNFHYDDAGRLAGVSGATSEFYLFDAVGNRTASQRSTSYMYDPSQFNQLTASDTASYAYDANGNVRTKAQGSDLWRFSWDFDNRLTSAATRRQSVRYKYDALGRRFQRFVVGGTGNTKFIHDGADVIADDDSGVLTKYLNGPGIDEKLRFERSGEARYFLSDHLGSTEALTDASGRITSDTGYDSFGNANGDPATRYRFTGREFDELTGLHYYRARWYDADLGRFISEDPIGFAAGDVNLYGYVENDPVNGTDPTGLYEEDVHFYLTWYLASKNRCFSSAEARYVAFSTQYVDENPMTRPSFGDTPRQRSVNRNHHALHSDSHETFKSGLWRQANDGERSNRLGNLGVYLHYEQDSFSHAGYGNPIFGHAFGTHRADKTSADVGKAIEMANSTWTTLNNWTRINCGCEASLEPEMIETIQRFSNARGGNWFTERLFSIEQVNASYLEQKRAILRLPNR
jgi:RHS repeat-associated protein